MSPYLSAGSYTSRGKEMKETLIKEGECACPNPLGIKDGKCLTCGGSNPKIKPIKIKKERKKKDEKK